MKARTKFLSLIFGTAIATSAIIAPSIALSSCSNGNDTDPSDSSGNNIQNETKPTPPSTVDTSNIKTFAQALSFAKDYLNKYYTLDMFKSDVNEYAKIMSNPNLEVTIDKIIANKNKTINYTLINNNIDNSNTNLNLKVIAECKEFTISPILVQDNNIIKIGIYLPPPQTIQSLPNPVNPENNFTGARNNFIRNNINYGWISAQNTQNIDQNKIYIPENNSNFSPSFPFQCFSCYSLNISFSSLLAQEISNHLIK